MTHFFDRLLNFGGIVIWIALCLGNVFWLWDKYICCRAETGNDGCHRRQNYSYKQNLNAYGEYNRRMRAQFAIQVKAMSWRNIELVEKFKRGDYTDNRQAFQADTKGVCDSLLESVEDFDGQPVPDVMEKAHDRIDTCFRLHYESIQALRETSDAEGADRDRLLHEAEKKLKDANRNGVTGLELYNEIRLQRPG